MLIRRKQLGCVVHQNYIYAVGGRDDLAELSSAERYDVQNNRWELIVPMKSKRSGVRKIKTDYSVVENNIKLNHFC